MARHFAITPATGTWIFSCDSGSPWQGASSENTTRLRWQNFPKVTDRSGYSGRGLARVAMSGTTCCESRSVTDPARFF
ncbi:MAG: hypothetical protein ABWX92_03870 [Mycetocola sp.]